MQMYLDLPFIIGVGYRIGEHQQVEFGVPRWDGEENFEKYDWSTVCVMWAPIPNNARTTQGLTSRIGLQMEISLANLI